MPVDDVSRRERVRRALCAREMDSPQDRKSTRLNSSHGYISYAVFCLKKKTQQPSSRRSESHPVACPPRAVYAHLLTLAASLLLPQPTHAHPPTPPRFPSIPHCLAPNP